MILDDLTCWRQYAALSPRFEQAFLFLETADLNGSMGRHEIDGDDLYVIVQDHLTKSPSQRPFEAHRRYIDIHCVIRGSESICWAPLSALDRVTKPYTAEADEILFAPPPETLMLPLRARQFAIFFPADGHLPSCATGEPTQVGKMVVKVRL